MGHTRSEKRLNSRSLTPGISPEYSKAWANGLLIELDETPIGTFVELEGPSPAIDRAAEELGFTKHDYVLKNYLRLYMEDCRRKGEEPRHMVFPNGKRRSP